MIISPEAVKKFGADLAAQSGRHRAVPVRRVGQGRSPDAQAVRRLLGQAGRPVPGRDPLPPDPRRHGQDSEPGRRRDRRDGLRRAARRGDAEGRTASVVEVDVPSLATFNYQFNMTRPPFDKKELRQAVAYALDIEAIVKGVWLGVGVAVQRADRAVLLGLRQHDQADQARRGEGEAVSGRRRPAERLQLRRRRPTTSRSTSRKPRR